MAISNFEFEVLGTQTLSPVSELVDEGCELCKSNAAGATLCESCADMIRRLAAIQSKDNQRRAMVATRDSRSYPALSGILMLTACGESDVIQKTARTQQITPNEDRHLRPTLRPILRAPEFHHRLLSTVCHCEPFTDKTLT
jgi:hypothetical protein